MYICLNVLTMYLCHVCMFVCINYVFVPCMFVCINYVFVPCLFVCINHVCLYVLTMYLYHVCLYVLTMYLYHVCMYMHACNILNVLGMYCITVLGPMLRFKKYFRQKLAKILAFLFKILLFYKNLIITLIFEKSTLSAENWRKSQKLVII
jgi:hypothetical protein